MHVHLVGDGPPIEAVRGGLAAADVETTSGSVGEATADCLPVISGATGAEIFSAASDAFTTWVAIESGGIGGVELEDVGYSVGTFTAGGGCYRCLGTRVQSCRGTGDSPGPPSDGGQDTGAVDAGPPATTEATDAWQAGALAAGQAVACRDGTVQLSSVIELPHTQRQFLPVPGCDCLSDGSGLIPAEPMSLPLEPIAESLAETVGRAELALDDRVGLITEVGEAHSFPAPYYLATVADTTEFSDGDAPDKAGGVAQDWTPALMKALGEGLERYAAAMYETDQLRRAPPAELDAVVPPAAFAGASNDTPGTDSDEPSHWVEGINLQQETTTWLPAEAVLFPPPSSQYLPSITTGLGLGRGSAGAVHAGLFEVIERDATMLSWYSTFEPVALDIDDTHYQHLARRARAEDLTVTPLLVTQDLDVPVVTVALSREEWPRFAVGASADLDPATAATDALAEALQNWMELRATGPDRARSTHGNVATYAATPGEAAAFADVEQSIDAAAIAPEASVATDAAVEEACTMVDDAGLTAYAVRLTPPDLAAIGFEATRVLVPGAQPLQRSDVSFGERARTVPETLGYDPRLDGPSHPYP